MRLLSVAIIHDFGTRLHRYHYFIRLYRRVDRMIRATYLGDVKSISQSIELQPDFLLFLYLRNKSLVIPLCTALYICDHSHCQEGPG